jgi:cytochrome c-type biogenesis protein CcmE
MDRPTKSPPKRRAKFLIGGGVIVAALLGLVVFAMSRPGATSFYRTVSEVRAEGATTGAQQIKVNGMLVKGSDRAEGVTTTFDITDGTRQVTVTTDRPLPDAFYTDSNQVEIIAQGRFDGEVFTASQVFAKCPSKFKARA